VSIWDVGSILVKLLNLLAMASIIGGGFGLIFLSNLDARINRHVALYMSTGIGVGVLGAVIFILLQVGAINQSGITGALDPQVANILIQSSLGYSAELRIVGYLIGILIVALLTLPGRKESSGKIPGIVASVLLVLAILMFGISFPLTGHVADLNILSKVAITLHATAVLWWVGSLYPLWYTCRVIRGSVLAPKMHRFGQMALIIVGILILTGGYLLFELLELPAGLVQSPYGISFSIKLAGVYVLLLLAAINRLILVPRLANYYEADLLQGTIMAEMIVAVAILLVTSYLTTFVGISSGE